jgi:segregation and condensation protein B
MSNCPMTLGRCLRSVALRYRQPARWLERLARGVLLGTSGAEAMRDGKEQGNSARQTHVARLEAILFLAREPLGSRKLAQLTGLADGTKARTLVRALNRRYDAEGSAFRVEEIAGGFQLLTRARYAPWLRRFISAAVEVRLSAPAMETLAVVAFRQPVLRAEIESIRGVQCGEVLRQLIERDLVRIVGRSEELGRPLLYGTTRQFLQVFGLRHLDDLPRPEFLPITKSVTEESADAVAGPPTSNLQPFHHSRENQEETDMSITIDKKSKPERLGTASVTTSERPMCVAKTIYAAAADEDDEGDEEEDEDDLDDEPWEEVDDEDEDDDFDDDEDDWDEDEDFDDEEDDDWDDDEDDDDWDDDEEEEEAGEE